MHFAILPPWAAPVSTGHPFGLPETGVQTRDVTRVTPVARQSSADTGMARDTPSGQVWHTPDAEPDPATHVAPPSIMQLKISALLDKQADRLSDDVTEPELPEHSIPDEPAETVPPVAADVPHRPETAAQGYANHQIPPQDPTMPTDDSLTRHLLRL